LNTIEQYNEAFEACKQIFRQKTIDYGTSWRALRPRSVTDQIFIKANRIRTIEENDTQRVEEGVESEFMGIVNYCVIALIQLDLGWEEITEIDADQALVHFTGKQKLATELMVAKNHDYGEAWRDMRVSSMTDLILMKLLRIKQIEDNEGETLISEGVDAGYLDIVNYALFALIKLTEAKEKV